MPNFAEEFFMSQSPFSKSPPSSPLSFHEILEGISQDSTQEFKHNSRSNFEWSSVVDNTILLSNLFSEDHATPHFPYGKAIHSYTSNIRVHSQPHSESQSHKQTLNVNKTSQDNVPQPTVNPLWNTLIKSAYEKINAREVISLKPDQQRLSVFFTASELKKIYRQRAKITHPDQSNGSHLQFIELKKNYQILMDFLKKID